MMIKDVNLDDLLKLNNMSFVCKVKTLLRSVHSGEFESMYKLSKTNINVVEKVAFRKEYGNDKSIYDYLDSSMYLDANRTIRVIFVNDEKSCTITKFFKKCNIDRKVNSFATIFLGTDFITNENTTYRYLYNIVNIYITNNIDDYYIPDDRGYEINVNKNALNYNIAKFSILDSILDLKYDDFDKFGFTGKYSKLQSVYNFTISCEDFDNLEHTPEYEELLYNISVD